jgi:hypothetical protein
MPAQMSSRAMKLGIGCLVLWASQSAALAQSGAMFPTNAAISNTSKLSYKVNFQTLSETSSTGSGDTSSFTSTSSVSITPPDTEDRPFTISDSTATRGGSNTGSVEINRFFPKNSYSDGAAADSSSPGVLENKFKDLSKVEISLDVAPKELTEEDKQKIILSSNFTTSASTTLSTYAESSSPNFVSSFQNVLLNKKFLTR